MAKDWWETEDLGGKLEKVKVSDGPVGLRCLAITDSWENDSIFRIFITAAHQNIFCSTESSIRRN